MDNLPSELFFKIFCLLDYRNLAIAQQVCRKWKELASDDTLWYNLFIERWGGGQAEFFAPTSKSWKDVYEVQDRGDRFGLGLKIIREGGEYYLVHQGEIQRYLGSRKPTKGVGHDNMKRAFLGEESFKEPCLGVSDRMLFFLGDMEVAARDAKRNRIL